MGSYLGKTDPSASSSAQVRTDLPTGRTNRRPSPPLYQMHRVQHVHCVHSGLQHRPARRLPRWDPSRPPARRVNEAWRRFPMRRTQNSIMRPLPSDWWESYCKRTIWSLRHPRPVCSPVTVKISPPERRAAASLSPANVINSAGPLASEQPPDPCAKETVLRALRECGERKQKREQPQLPEGLRRRSAPGARPSAFKPLVKTGAPPRFVPRRGPLKRSRNSWGPDADLSRRPSWSSWSSGASTHTGPPSSKRNPISSSYSSSRYFSEPWRRSILRASLQSPEWPIKKQDSGGQPHSPVPPDTGSESSEACVPSGSPLLLPRPADPLPVSPAPWSGDGIAEEDLALGGTAGLLGSNRARKDTTEAPADRVPGGRPAVHQPSSAGAAAQGPDPLLEGVQAMRKSPSPRGSPRATGEAVSATCSPPAPAGCSQSQPLPGPCSESRSRAACISPAPSGTRSPVTGTVPQADRADVSPAAPPTQSAQSALKGSPTPQPPEPVPAAHMVLKPRWEPQHDMGKGDAIYSSTAPAAAFPSPFLCTAPGTTTPTFKPIFRGAVAPLTTLPVPAPFPTKQPSAPFPPASSHLFHSLVKATSVVMSTSLTSAPTDSTLKPALSLGVVSMASAVGSTCSVPSTWHTFLLGATQALRTGFSPGTGLFLPSPQRPTIPPVRTVTIFSQVLPSAVQIASSSSSNNNANFSVSGSPLSAPALVPTLSPRSSSLTPVSTSPTGSSPRPPFPPSPGAPHLPATNGLKQGHSQPVVPTSFSSSSLSGNSKVLPPTPMPAPSWPNLGGTTQPGFGDQTSSASTFYPPASFKPDLSSGFPFSQTSIPGFGAVTQKRRSGACGPVFGSKAPRPFAFGGVVTPMDCGEPEQLSPTVPDMSSTRGAFGTGAVPSGAPGPGTPFGKSWRQNTQGLSGQSTPFALGRSSLSARNTTFGMASMSPFAQSASFFGKAKAGSSLGFGLLSPTAQDTVARGPFRPALPSFSIGAKSKTPKKWEQGHSRRHRAHRK
nr:POM121-like protein 2 [Oryctolagus cuniculus]